MESPLTADAKFQPARPVDDFGRWLISDMSDRELLEENAANMRAIADMIAQAFQGSGGNGGVMATIARIMSK